MAEAYAVPSTLAHVHLIAPRMRSADRAEVLASHGFTPAQALLVALQHSEYARTVFIDSEAVAMYGVDDNGTIWALTTDAVDKHPRAFWQASRYAIAQLRRRYPMLENCIDARYLKSLRWARRLGFKVEDEPHRCGLLGLPFHRITLEA